MGVSIYYFGAKLSEMYIETNKGQETRKETLEIIADLKKAFNEIIGENSWMDEGRSRSKQSYEKTRIESIPYIYRYLSPTVRSNSPA